MSGIQEMKKFVVKLEAYLTVESESKEDCQRMLQELDVDLKYHEKLVAQPILARLLVEAEERYH